MKPIQVTLIAALFLILSACGNKKDKTDSFDINASSKPKTEKEKASTRVELDNKGVGPISSVVLGSEIDNNLARTGEGIYKQYCTACHKPDVTFIGPAPKGILKRRSPEWVMNMILNPGRMIRDDQLAKDLFMEFNGSPMANQGLTEDEARAVLEYFRTL